MTHTRTKLLRYTVLSAGLLGMTLRALLYATAIDQRGLLIANHWATWAILILTALVLGILLLMIRKNRDSADYSDLFPASFLQAVTSVAAAAAIAVRSWMLYPIAGDTLELAATIAGFAAGIGLLLVGICRLAGKQPSFLFHSGLTIFFAFLMVSQYRTWSADPQLMDYGFYLAALICLMLTAYFLAAIDTRMGTPSGALFFSMAASFFCCLALPESNEVLLLTACALWAFTCAPRMQIKPHQQTSATDE